MSRLPSASRPSAASANVGADPLPFSDTLWVPWCYNYTIWQRTDARAPGQITKAKFSSVWHKEVRVLEGRIGTKSMFTDIYVSIQGSQLLQERWVEEADQDRPASWVTRLLSALTSK